MQINQLKLTEKQKKMIYESIIKQKTTSKLKEIIQSSIQQFQTCQK